MSTGNHWTWADEWRSKLRISGNDDDVLAAWAVHRWKESAALGNEARLRILGWILNALKRRYGNATLARKYAIDLLNLKDTNPELCERWPARQETAA